MSLKRPVTIAQARQWPAAAARRASFCARMGGMREKLTGERTARDPRSKINQALAAWDCDEPELLKPQHVSKGVRPMKITRKMVGAEARNPARKAAKVKRNPAGQVFETRPEPLWISKDKGILLSPHYVGTNHYEIRPVQLDTYYRSAAEARQMAEWAADQFRMRGYPTPVYVVSGVTSASKGAGRKRTGFTVTSSPGGYPIVYAFR